MLTSSQLQPPSGAPSEPDGIQRMKELLSSAISHGYGQTERIQNALDHIAGPAPKATTTEATAPMPPLAARTIYSLLNDLELMQRRMDEQLNRMREQLP